jgi:hypothetical protein
MGVKSDSYTRVFLQKNSVQGTSGLPSNPGVLRVFPERKKDNQSPIRAYFPGGKVPYQAQNSTGFYREHSGVYFFHITVMQAETDDQEIHGKSGP